MEINPFHNGHEYFLKEVRKRINKEDYIVCSISTTITQRGEITVLDKKTKTEILLDNGVDLVVELPLIMANQGGEHYAFHNIQLLNNLGVEKLYFGSESDNIDLIKQQIEKPVTNKEFSRGYLKEEIGELKSNDILGMSYIKAIKKINPNIQYETIKRVNSNYNDEELNLNKNICSATAIRMHMGEESKIKNYLPPKVLKNLLSDIDQKKIVELLMFQILNLKEEKEIFLGENGQLINKIKKKLEKLKVNETKKDYTLEEIAKECSDKNNSKYKINRILINIIFEITTSDVQTYIDNVERYKVLGFSKRYSKEIKKNSNLFISYKKRDNIYNINDKVDKILNLYFGRDFKFNYEKPVIK